MSQWDQNENYSKFSQNRIICEISEGYEKLGNMELLVNILGLWHFALWLAIGSVKHITNL